MFQDQRACFKINVKQTHTNTHTSKMKEEIRDETEGGKTFGARRQATDREVVSKLSP